MNKNELLGLMAQLRLFVDHHAGRPSASSAASNEVADVLQKKYNMTHQEIVDEASAVWTELKQKRGLAMSEHEA
jgi:hypothetical protein